MAERIVKKNRDGEIKRKIIILLLGGLAISLSRNPKQQFKILSEMHDDWKGLRTSSLKRAIKSTHRDRLISEVRNSDGSVKIVLSEKGRKLAKFYSLDDLSIKKPVLWDDNWRIVIFDVPEKFKKIRDALRMHLRNLGFFELQKSVFVHPFPCLEEIDQIVHFYNAKDHVRLIVAHTIDNEMELKQKFGLL